MSKVGVRLPLHIVRAQGEALAEQYGHNAPPIDPTAIARAMGIPVVKAQLGEEISGLLVSKAGSITICVQAGDHRKRQRFTVAHELGHHVLGHHNVPGDHVHVDRGHFISRRGPRAAAGVDRAEIAANQFAASLLMPSALLKAIAGRVAEGPLHDVHVAELADRFDVSEQAMTIRLSALDYI